MRYFGKPGGGYTSGLWRGRLGINIGNGLVFRRISKNIRKFAVVRENTMEVYNDKHHESYRDIQPDGEIPKKCSCPRHNGSLKVRFKGKIEFDLYAQIGEIKG